MKKIIYLMCAILALPFVNSCSDHEIPYYEGEDAIFFDQQYGVAWFDTVRLSHQIYSLVSFGLMVENDSLLEVKVETTGYVRDYDRPFGIEIVADSTNAIEGVEFELLETNPVIRAGQNSVRFPVLCHRTARMDDQTLQLQLRLVPGEHFTLPFGPDGIGMMPKRHEGGEVYTQYSTNHDPSILNIFISGLLQKPAQWNVVQFGYNYSDKKFRLMLDISNEVFGWTVADFQDQRMSSRCQLVAKHVAAYLMEEYNKGREHWVLDEDGSMMYVKGVIWTEGQNPDTFN